MNCCQTVKCKALQHITPCSMVILDNGILCGLHPNPSKFDSFDNTADYSRARSQYKNGSTQITDDKKKTFSCKSSDTRLAKLKSGAIGKSTITSNNCLSFKSVDNNLLKQKLHSVRNSSCVPPPKSRYII